jgi:hypothetical protein
MVKRALFPLVALAVAGIWFATSACAKRSEVASSHRAVAVACEKARGPGNPGKSEGGMCKADADCTKGKNGRCQLRGARYRQNECTYDECFSDADCDGGKGVCGCEHDATNQGAGHYCSPGNCRVDADCGKGGFCSPSMPNCSLNGPYYPTGYFCHTKKDECTNDDDCKPPSKKGYGPIGTRCAWAPESARWVCSSEECPVG